MKSSIPDIPVIYFHSVAPQRNPYWTKNYLTLNLSYFVDFLDYLKKNRWRTIFLDEYYHLRIKNRKAGPKVCVLTFDDGYTDNYIYVWPFLKKYGFNATIFVNPESSVEDRNSSLTLEDVWGGNATMEETDYCGFLSWKEMEAMQASGNIDIQSHAFTHTKYFVSSKLSGFHHPGADCQYYVGNLFKDRARGYMRDREFEKLVPYGFPVFEEQSSVTARKITINQQFTNECIHLLKDYDFNDYRFEEANSIIKPLLEKYHEGGDLISSVESLAEYEKRVRSEIKLSREIISGKLGKEVKFLCWPHGDNNDFCQASALEEGFLMTTSGKAVSARGDLNRIGERMGIRFNNTLMRARTVFKMKALSGSFPYREALSLGRKFGVSFSKNKHD